MITEELESLKLVYEVCLCYDLMLFILFVMNLRQKYNGETR